MIGEEPQQMALLPHDQASEQWRVERMDTMNWGGYDGAGPANGVELDLGGLESPFTLFVGDNGVGKTANLDALALAMHGQGVRFNPAAGDESGRGQRSILSYTRGYTGSTYKEDLDRTTEDYLRFDPEDPRPVWSAVLVRWAKGPQTLTCAVLNYCTAEGEVSVTYATARGPAPSPAAVEAAAREQFSPEAVAEAWPGCSPTDKRSQYLADLDAAVGHSPEARRVLAMARSFTGIKSVDSFLKRTLELPEAPAKAEDALKAFKDIDRYWREAKEAEERLEVLDKVASAHEDHTVRKASFDLLWSLLVPLYAEGSEDDPDRTPVGADGPSEALRGLMDEAEGALLAERASVLEGKVEVADAALKEAKRAEEDADARSTAAWEAYQQVGGSSIEEARRKAADAREAANRRRKLVERIRGKVEEAGSPFRVPDSLSAHEAVLGAVGEAEDRAQTLMDEAAEKRAQATADLRAADSEARELRAEAEHYRSTKGRVDRGRARVRDTWAERAGLSAGDTPFVGELMDVAPEESGWAAAAEAVLRPLALTIAVPDGSYEAYKRSADRTKVSPRTSHMPAVPGLPRGAKGRPGGLAEKIRVADGPFAGWLERTLALPKYDFLCIDGPDDYVPGTDCVCRSGQVLFADRRRGGAHGTSGARVIGTDNSDILKEIKEKERAAAARRDQAKADAAEADRAGRYAHALDQAVSAFYEHEAEEYDVAGALEEAGRLDRLAAELESSREVADAKGLYERARSDLKDAQKAANKAEEAQESLSASLEAAKERSAGLLATPATATDDQRGQAAPVIADKVPKADADDFDAELRQWRAAATDALESKAIGMAGALATAAAAVTGAEEEYKARFDEPGMGVGTSEEVVEEYLDARDTIAGTIDPEATREWAGRMGVWASKHMTPVRTAYTRYLPAVKSRLAPINEILASDRCRFGPKGSTVQLELAPPDSTQRAAADFRDALNSASQWAENAYKADDEEMERVRDSIAEFMERLERECDAYRSAHDKRVQTPSLLDPRNLFEVQAHVTAPDGTRNTVTNLDGMSGGERSEMTAFLIGSALLYKLTEKTQADFPCAAPLVIDEAFARCDPNYARRGMAALKALGFQTIMAGPQSLFSIARPFLTHCVAVTRNQATDRCHLTVIPIEEDEGDEDAQG